MSAPAPNPRKETGTMTSPEPASTATPGASGPARRAAAWILAAALAAAVAAPAAARAQADAPPGAAVSGPADTAAASEPEIAPAPRQFRLGLTGGGLFWNASTSRAPRDAGAFGLDVERILVRYLSLRLGARAEWRAYTASLQTLFEPTDRSGATRHAQRLLVSLYWTF